MKNLLLLSFLLLIALNSFSQRCYEIQPFKNTTSKEQFWKATGATALTIIAVEVINRKYPKYQKYCPFIYAGWAKVTVKILKPNKGKKSKSRRKIKRKYRYNY